MIIILKRWLAGMLAALFLSMPAVLTVLGCFWGRAHMSPDTWGWAGFVGFVLGWVTAGPTIAVMEQWNHNGKCKAREPGHEYVSEGKTYWANGRVINEAACDCDQNLKRHWYRERVAAPAPLVFKVNESAEIPRDELLRRANEMVEKEPPLNWRNVSE